MLIGQYKGAERGRGGPAHHRKHSYPVHRRGGGAHRGARAVLRLSGPTDADAGGGGGSRPGSTSSSAPAAPCSSPGTTGCPASCGGWATPRRPIFFIAISCVLNIVGDLILVGGLRNGAAGAAVATVAAQAVSFLLSLRVLRGGDFPSISALLLRDPGRPGEAADEAGVPICLQDGLVTLSFVLITAVVNAIRTGRVGGGGRCGRIIGFAMLIPIAFMSAPVRHDGAEHVGAGLPERARRGTLIATGTSWPFRCCSFSPFSWFRAGHAAVHRRRSGDRSRRAFICGPTVWMC